MFVAGVWRNAKVLSAVCSVSTIYNFLTLIKKSPKNSEIILKMNDITKECDSGLS